jgi:tyrosine-protein phosphatase SIW14
MQKRPLIIIALVLCVGGSMVAWHKVIRHELFPRNFGIVVPDQIYRSGQLTPRMLRQVVEEHGIKTVIALNGADAAVAEEGAILAELGVDHLVFNLSGDGTGGAETYGEVVCRMADPATHPILVHCAAGAQRTTTAAIAYQHLIEHKAIADVYAESFNYKHKPDEWKLLAFLSDDMDQIEAAWRACGSTGSSPPASAPAAPPASAPAEPDAGRP